MTAGIIILLILALLLVIFTLQNTTLISLKIFFWEVADVPLVLALLVCLITGFLIAYLVQYNKILKLKRKLKTAGLEIDELKKDMENEDSVPAEGIEIQGGEEEGFFSE